MKSFARYFRQLWSLFFLFLVAGCNFIKEGEYDCQTTTILFTYTSDKGNDIFSDNIHSVDAFIFDADKKLVMSRRFESAELAQFAGWKVDKLLPGDYYVVCWGNVHDNSRMNNFASGVTTFDECIIQIPDIVTTTGDQIYYAPNIKHPESRSGVATRATDPALRDHVFTVIAQKDNVKVMPFVRAHRTINVYIVGYPDNSPPATVTGMQLATQYDFYYKTGNIYRNFTQTALPITTLIGDALLATFHVGYSPITENMEFILREGPNGKIIATVNLREFLRINPEAFGNTIDILISICCDCGPNPFDLGVSITIPPWLIHDVTPEK